MEHCPRCQSTALRRTPTETLLQRARRAITRERPHKCRECGWHGWGPPRTERRAEKGPTVYLGDRSPDFHAVDAELRETHRIPVKPLSSKPQS